MRKQEEVPAQAAPPSAQFVGNAFVEQYYHILHRSPGLVHRFYQDSSLLSRPDANGNMATVTTMQVSPFFFVNNMYSFYVCLYATKYVCWCTCCNTCN